ncbi:MAG: hypothetical protein HW421_3005 [Ignavibacteria bacterium]|nr:hypothetical protein [Ignavibacteria bacterium]
MTNSIITIDPEIQSGSPVFSGTRVPIKSFFDYISTGETIESYLEDYPYITQEQVYALMTLMGDLFIKTTDTIFNENTFGRKYPH